MTNLTETEPVAVATAIPTAVGAVLTVLVAFGVHLTQDQLTGILGAIAAITALAGAVARSKVWSPAGVRRLLDLQSAAKATPGPAPAPPEGGHGGVDQILAVALCLVVCVVALKIAGVL